MQGTIGGRDFAASVVSCARLKHVDQYLDKLQVLPATACTWPEQAQLAWHTSQAWPALPVLFAYRIGAGHAMLRTPATAGKLCFFSRRRQPGRWGVV